MYRPKGLRLPRLLELSGPKRRLRHGVQARDIPVRQRRHLDMPALQYYIVPRVRGRHRVCCPVWRKRFLRCFLVGEAWPQLRFAIDSNTCPFVPRICLSFSRILPVFGAKMSGIDCCRGGNVNACAMRPRRRNYALMECAASRTGCLPPGRGTWTGNPTDNGLPPNNSQGRTHLHKLRPRASTLCGPVRVIMPQRLGILCAAVQRDQRIKRVQAIHCVRAREAIRPHSGHQHHRQDMRRCVGSGWYIELLVACAVLDINFPLQY